MLTADERAELIALRAEAAELDRRYGPVELPPVGGSAMKCPKCGCTMTGGAPHGPWPVQWECRQCGTTVAPK